MPSKRKTRRTRALSHLSKALAIGEKAVQPPIISSKSSMLALYVHREGIATIRDLLLSGLNRTYPADTQSQRHYLDLASRKLSEVVFLLNGTLATLHDLEAKCSNTKGL